VTKLIRHGDAIEGAAVRLQARNRLISRPAMRVNGLLCCVWTTSFNIRAEIERELQPDAQRIVPSASTSMSDELLCDSATIFSLKDKYSEEITMGSSTHQCQVRHFHKQTAVVVDGPHLELIRSAAKSAPK